MDLLSQIFVKRDLAVRRGIFLTLTALMMVTGFSSKASDKLGWWQASVSAPQIRYYPEMISTADQFVKVQVRAAQSLTALEISIDAGADWVPVNYLTGAQVSFDDSGKDAQFKFSLQAGHLARILAPSEAGDKRVRSLLLRGVTREGTKTAPKSLAFLYAKNTSGEEPL